MNKIKLLSIHRKDLNNIGDMASEPLQYFLKSSEYRSIDITRLTASNLDPEVPIVVGGGGLIGNPFFEDCLIECTDSFDRLKLFNTAEKYWDCVKYTNKDVRDEFLQKINELVYQYSEKLDNSKTPRFLWGAGHNKEMTKKTKEPLFYPRFLRKFAKVGIRDFNTQFTWAPCASCMHPALRKFYPIKNQIIFYEHKKQLLKSTDFSPRPVPRFINSGNNIEQTIELLGSASIILTNSYHGAYWGILLGKKVIIVEPWSSKFFNFKHQPFTLNKGEDFMNILDSVPTYPNALDECVAATETFWKEILGSI